MKPPRDYCLEGGLSVASIQALPGPIGIEKAPPANESKETLLPGWG